MLLGSSAESIGNGSDLLMLLLKWQSSSVLKNTMIIQTYNVRACACACVCSSFIFYIWVYVLTQVPEHVVEEIETFVEQVSHIQFPSSL